MSSPSNNQPLISNKKKFVKPFLLVLKLAITGFCLFHIVHKFGPEITVGLNDVNWLYVILGISLFALSQIIAVFRWQLCCVKLGIVDSRDMFSVDSRKRFVSNYFTGLFMNNFLPGSVGGDLVRSYLLKRDLPSAKWVYCFGSVFVDRVFGLYAMSWIGFIFALLLRFVFNILLPDVIFYLICFMFFASLIVLVLLIVFSKKLKPVSEYEAGHEEELNWKQKLFLYLAEFVQSVKEIQKDKTALGVIIACSLFIQGLIPMCLIALKVGLNLSVSAFYMWIVNPLVTVGAIVAPSINGLGVRESIYAYFFKSVGEPGGSGVLLSGLWLVTLFVVSLPGALGAIRFMFKK